MRNPSCNKVEFGHVPLMVRIGQAERLFGVSRSGLMKLVKAGKVRTVRLGERGQHRFPTYELATALGMADMVPRVGIPVNRDLLRNIENEVRDAVGKAQVAFRHELKVELDKVRNGFRSMVEEIAVKRSQPQPAVNKPLKGWPPNSTSYGGY